MAIAKYKETKELKKKAVKIKKTLIKLKMASFLLLCTLTSKKVLWKLSKNYEGCTLSVKLEVASNATS